MTGTQVRLLRGGIIHGGRGVCFKARLLQKTLAGNTATNKIHRVCVGFGRGMNGGKVDRCHANSLCMSLTRLDKTTNASAKSLLQRTNRQKQINNNIKLSCSEIPSQIEHQTHYQHYKL